jgi:hypothetical protein
VLKDSIEDADCRLGDMYEQIHRGERERELLDSSADGSRLTADR